MSILLSLASLSCLLLSADASPILIKRNLGSNNQGGISSQVLTWIAVVASLLVFSFLFLVRYNRVNRWHRPTLRAVFLPINLNIPWLGIKPVPIRPYRAPESLYPHQPPRSRRRVSGAEVGLGGQRLGRRDLDDMDVASTDELPEYKAQQPGLPNYQQAWDSENPSASTSASEGHQNMLSVEEYERATRVPRAEAAEQIEMRQRGDAPSSMPILAEPIARAANYLATLRAQATGSSPPAPAESSSPTAAPTLPAPAVAKPSTAHTRIPVSRGSISGNTMTVTRSNQ